MKKYILSLIFIVSLQSPIMASQEKASSQELVITQKFGDITYTDHLEQLSFTAFHPHELDPSLPRDPDLQPSLHERFSVLPDELQHEISSFLVKFGTEPDSEIGENKIIVDEIWERGWDKAFQFSLQRNHSIGHLLTKDFLRTHYWLQSTRQAQLSEQSKKWKYPNYTDETKYPLYNYSQALNKCCSNKYGEHNLEIALLALICGANIHSNILGFFSPDTQVHKTYILSKFLLQQETPISMSDYSYQTPLNSAIKNDFIAMTQLFTIAGLTLGNELCMHTAAKYNACRMLQYLHNIGYDLNAKTNDDRHLPLHSAAFYGHRTAIQTLLDLGADSTLKDVHGRTYNDYL